MRVLVGCEFSGIVREAFKARGHDAWSCDLLPTELPGNHIKDDVLKHLDEGWDLGVFHPPCTFLTISANKWYKPEFKSRFPNREKDRDEAVEFFLRLYNARIPKVAVENPIGIMSSRFRKPDQVVQPWMFGHGETKATCFWLRGLRLLQPTHRKDDLFCVQEPVERIQRLHLLPPSKTRWKERSRTFPGIARAMAEQWG